MLKLIGIVSVLAHIATLQAAPTRKQIEQKQAEETAKIQQAAEQPIEIQRAAEQARADGALVEINTDRENCGKVKMAVVGDPDDRNCAHLTINGGHIHALHNTLDGTKNYVSLKAHLANGKQLDAVAKLNALYEDVAESITAHLYDITLQQLHNGGGGNNFHYTGQIVPGDLAADATLAGAAHANNHDLGTEAGWHNIFNDEIISSIHHERGHSILVQHRQALLVSLYTLSFLKVADLDNIDAGFTRDQLKNHIAKQLWAMDWAKYAHILSQQHLHIHTTENNGTLIADFRNHLTNTLNVAGKNYNLGQINYVTVVANLKKLKGL